MTPCVLMRVLLADKSSALSHSGKVRHQHEITNLVTTSVSEDYPNNGPRPTVNRAKTHISSHIA